MQLRILKEPQISAKLDIAIRQTLGICFPRGSDAFWQSRACKGIRPMFTVVIQDADTVIAHLAVIDRIIKAGVQQFRVAGVANVCVLPEHRGKGLSDQILNAAMQEAGKGQFECGLLFTGENIKRVYARNGWQVLPGVTVIRVENGREICRQQNAVTMRYPLRRTEFPPGVIHLQGNDW